MADSLNLVTAQISFLEPELTLIHIPIELYTAFVQPIFRLLFGEGHDEDVANSPWTERHDFLNVSITTVECSIICDKRLAEIFFCPLLKQHSTRHGVQSTSKNGAEMSCETYIVIQVDGQGLDAGQRVLELTSPLAMAGISIFFITTYFSDYILVPSHSRRAVAKTLEQRGFVFSQSADAFVSQLSPSSPTLPHHNHQPSTSPPGSNGSMPSTPPAKDIPELQTRTFKKLKRNNITPIVNRDLRIVNCAGNRDYDAAAEERLKNDLMQVLLSTTSETLTAAANPTPSITGLAMSNLPATNNEQQESSRFNFSTTFLSLTLTSSEPISLFLEHRLLPRLGSTLLGAKDDEDTLIPITLDLRMLGRLDETREGGKGRVGESVGIVCGVAGRLAQGASEEARRNGWLGDGEGVVESGRCDGGEKGGIGDITFLSTAKAGTVLVRADEVERAVEALEWGMRECVEDG